MLTAHQEGHKNNSASKGMKQFFVTYKSTRTFCPLIVFFLEFLQSWTKKHFKSNFCIQLWSLTKKLCYKWHMFTLPHYLKPVSGVQKVENGERWRGEGTRQKKGRGTSLTPPPHYLFSQPLIFELSSPSEHLKQAALYKYTSLSQT